MPVSRRGFLRLTGADSAMDGVALAARGLEAHFAEEEAQAQGQGPRVRPVLPPGVEEIKISSNENPLGPGRAAIDAIRGKFGEAGRYPFNASPTDSALVSAIADRFRVKPENIVLGAGSQELLKSAMRTWVTPQKSLVTALPTFENCTNFAKRHKLPLVEVKVDAEMRLDVEGMIAAGSKADVGLVFFNNPNNPTATVHGAKTVTDMVTRIRKASPSTVILIDEAYHEYVTDPSYESAVPLALSTPNVLVTRTFSKAYGMAGLRVGYAIGMADTMKRLAALRMPYNVNVFGVVAAMAALGNPQHIAAERARNTDVRAFTVKAIREMGMKPSDSHANFLFADVGMPLKDFRDGCAKQGVLVGRDFPPFEKSHCRISIGTMDEMRRATEVFRAVLASKPTTTTASTEKGGR
jgi:histidinol-phosphate aminotransferase